MDYRTLRAATLVVFGHRTTATSQTHLEEALEKETLEDVFSTEMLSVNEAAP